MEQICADLKAEHEALDTVVDGISEEVWNSATPAAGWDVKDTIVHLIQADIAARLAVSDAQAFAAAKAKMQTSGLDLLGTKEGKTGEEVLAWWRAERSQMIEAFGSRGPKDRIPWFGPDMSTLSFATARLMETWSHGHDVAETVGETWLSTGRIRHVAHLCVTTRGWSYLNRGMEVPVDPVRVELSSPSGELWTWGPEDAVDRITGAAEDFCLVATQRRHPVETTLVAEGDLASEWLGLAQAFAGPPTLPSKGRSS